MDNPYWRIGGVQYKVESVKNLARDYGLLGIICYFHRRYLYF
jgi:hypothetical protein